MIKAGYLDDEPNPEPEHAVEELGLGADEHGEVDENLLEEESRDQPIGTVPIFWHQLIHVKRGGGARQAQAVLKQAGLVNLNQKVGRYLTVLIDPDQSCHQNCKQF